MSTNCHKRNNDYYRITRRVGEKLNSQGKWVPEYKDFYGHTENEAILKYNSYMLERNGCDEKVLNEPLGKVIDEWLEQFFLYDNLADSTKKLYKDAYVKYFRPSVIAKIPLGSVSAIKIQNFYNNSSISLGSLRNIDKLLKKFYRHCALSGICNDITEPLRIPKNTNSCFKHNHNDIDVWEDSDLQKTILALSGTKLRFLVILAVNTGARFSELMALTYNDIKDNVLTINKQVAEYEFNGVKGKRLVPLKSNSSYRQIPLSNYVIDELEKHRELHQAEMMRKGYETEIIFSTEVGTYSGKNTIRKMLNRVYKQIDVPVHPFHSFRRTFGSNLSRAGVPIATVCKLMGHGDISTTQKYYLHISNDEKLDAVERIVHYSLGKTE